MVTIEQFDTEMIKQVKRQLELCAKQGIKLSIYDIVRMSLTNMNNGNFNNITSSVRPFFSSLDIKITLEELMSCEFPFAVHVYSKRIESFYKGLIANLQKQISSMNELKQIVDGLDTFIGTDELSVLLKQTYYTNDSIAYFIDEGYSFMEKKGGIPINEDIDNKITQFIDYIRYYYSLNLENEYKTGIKESSENIDNNLAILNISPQEKVDLLRDIYYGNYNSCLKELQSNITKEEVIIALLRNAVQTSLVSTNVEGMSSNERTLYATAEDMQNVLIRVRKITSKLLGENVNDNIDNMNIKQLCQNLNNLTYEDIALLSWLYMYTRKDEKSIDVVEHSFGKDYKIDNSNQNQYINDSQLLKIIESKEFREELVNDYHI